EDAMLSAVSMSQSVTFRSRRTLRAVMPHLVHICLSHHPPAAIYTLSLHDALPICPYVLIEEKSLTALTRNGNVAEFSGHAILTTDRKSTRLNSSHSQTSYAVFCL